MNQNPLSPQINSVIRIKHIIKLSKRTRPYMATLKVLTFYFKSQTSYCYINNNNYYQRFQCKVCFSCHEKFKNIVRLSNYAYPIICCISFIGRDHAFSFK